MLFGHQKNKNGTTKNTIPSPFRYSIWNTNCFLFGQCYARCWINWKPKIRRQVARAQPEDQTIHSHANGWDDRLYVFLWLFRVLLLDTNTKGFHLWCHVRFFVFKISRYKPNCTDSVEISILFFYVFLYIGCETFMLIRCLVIMMFENWYIKDSIL